MPGTLMDTPVFLGEIVAASGDCMRQGEIIDGGVI
jgi:hypothetical protein